MFVDGQNFDTSNLHIKIQKYNYFFIHILVFIPVKIC